VSAAQVAVTLAGAAAIAWVLWYFLFARRPGIAASVTQGIQEVRVIVKGGYTPDTIVVQAGRPVRLDFYRDETADCSERVVFDAFGIDRLLPAFQTTTIEITPQEPGEYRFRCGMSMLRGTLVVEPAGAPRPPDASPHRFHE